MTHYLDSELTLRRYDTSGVLASVGGISEQILQAWEEVSAMKLPRWRPTTVSISGMGGSGLGSDILKTAFGSRVRVPIIISNGYMLHGHVNKKTLVVSVSYSGNTEETIAAYKDGMLRGVKSFVITTGGTLGELASRDAVPLYRVKPRHNPCGQPRMGIGYPLGAIAALLHKFRLSNFISGEITRAAEHGRRAWKRVQFETPFKENPAKQLAAHLEEVVPVFIGTRFLGGALHTATNMMNENAKQFAVYHRLPEANHHLLEGLSFPPKLGRMLYGVFFDSSLVRLPVRQRTLITKDVFTKQGIPNEVVKLRGDDALSASLELVIICAAASAYLAMLHRIDPSEIPWVDYFKKHLH